MGRSEDDYSGFPLSFSISLLASSRRGLEYVIGITDRTSIILQLGYIARICFFARTWLFIQELVCLTVLGDCRMSDAVLSFQVRFD
jgi:hypothetical protein